MSLDSTTFPPEIQQAIPEDFFTQVPNALRSDKRLDGNAKILGGMIAALAKREGYCWSTNLWLAGQFDASESTILRWLKQLEKFGYVRIEYKKKTRRGTDRMIYLADYPKLIRDSTPQTIASAMVNTVMSEAQLDKRRGVNSATPTHSHSLPLPLQTRYPGGINSATQLESVLDSGKQKIKENSQRVLPPAAAGALSEVKTTFSFEERKEPKPTPMPYDMAGEKREQFQAMAAAEIGKALEGTGLKANYRAIDSRGRTLYEQACREAAAKEGN